MTKSQIKKDISIHVLLIFLKIITPNHPPHHRFPCPIHKGTNPTTTFITNNNTIYCFKCALHYDIIELYTQYHQTSYQNVLNQLHKIYLSQTYQTIKNQKKPKSMSINTPHPFKPHHYEAKPIISKPYLFKHISPLFNLVTDFYHHKLFDSINQTGINYLIQDRKLTTKTIKEFKLGSSFTKDFYSFRLINYLSKFKYDFEKLNQYGLVTYTTTKNKAFYRDTFKNSIIIPITNGFQKTYHFYSHHLNNSHLPKYKSQINFTNQPTFEFPFRFFEHLPTIKQTKTLIIHEGFFDTIQAWQHGIENVVSLIIISQPLSFNFITILQKYQIKVIIAFDNDTTGRDKSQSIYYQLTTNNIQAIIKTINLPVKDPDELIKKYGIETYKQIYKK